MGNVFCALTNAACIIPAAIFYKRGMTEEMALTIGTGVSSLLYHGNNDPPYMWRAFDDVAVRTTDVILSDMLVFHAANMLVFASVRRRWTATIVALPIVVYTAWIALSIRVGMMATYGVLAICASATKRPVKYMVTGTTFALTDLAALWAAETYGEFYYWTHGVHHVATFCALAAFAKAAPGFPTHTRNGSWLDL